MNNSIKREQSKLAYSAERENFRQKGKITYTKPQTLTVLLRDSLLINGSNTVNSYQQGGDINVGDED